MALREVLAAGGSDRRVELAQSRYEARLQEELIEPLLQSAAGMADYRERIRRAAAAAEICQQLLLLAPLAAADAGGSGVAGGRAREIVTLAKSLHGLFGGRS